VLLHWQRCTVCWLLFDSTIASPGGVLVPVRIVVSCSVIFAVFCLNTAMQPASHSWPIEMRDVSRAGKMLVLVAAVGSMGRLMLSLCVECM
jgi:hypothetical protein